MTIADKIIRKIDDFQTLPTIYSALTEVMSNPYSSANDVANVISSDQAAAAKVLKAANSPLYGYSGRIDTMTKAIMYMGFAEVKNLITLSEHHRYVFAHKIVGVLQSGGILEVFDCSSNFPQFSQRSRRFGRSALFPCRNFARPR